MIDLVKKQAKIILSRSGFYQKPSFLIIGAQKAGTTALYQILNQHPDLHGSSPKEIHFFDDASKYTTNYHRYHIHFKLGKSLKQNFEATPRYLAHPDVPKRLYQYNPELKLIILLREPVSRALSAWKMYHHEYQYGPFKHLHDPRSFEDAISKSITEGSSNPLSYTSVGMYADQINRYLSFFDRKQLLFLESNELRLNFDDSIKQLLNFIDISDRKLKLVEANQSVSSDRYEEVESKLKDHYKKPNEELFRIIGKRYDWS